MPPVTASNSSPCSQPALPPAASAGSRWPHSRYRPGPIALGAGTAYHRHRRRRPPRPADLRRRLRRRAGPGRIVRPGRRERLPGRYARRPGRGDVVARDSPWRQQRCSPSRRSPSLARPPRAVRPAAGRNAGDPQRDRGSGVATADARGVREMQLALTADLSLTTPIALSLSPSGPTGVILLLAYPGRRRSWESQTPTCKPRRPWPGSHAETQGGRATRARRRRRSAPAAPGRRPHAAPSRSSSPTTGEFAELKEVLRATP